MIESPLIHSSLRKRGDVSFNTTLQYSRGRAYRAELWTMCTQPHQSILASGQHYKRAMKLYEVFSSAPSFSNPPKFSTISHTVRHGKPKYTPVCCNTNIFGLHPAVSPAYLLFTTDYWALLEITRQLLQILYNNEIKNLLHFLVGITWQRQWLFTLAYVIVSSSRCSLELKFAITEEQKVCLHRLPQLRCAVLA